MKFHYQCSVRPGDFWRLSMSHTYHSPVGMVNIVFTIAMCILSWKFWNHVWDWVQVLMLLGIVLFPVIQPMIVYFKCKGQVMAIPAGLELTIDDQGILVEVGKQQELIHWKRVKGLILERNMIILRVDNKSGYFLTNRVLKKEREELIEFVTAHIK